MTWLLPVAAFVAMFGQDVLGVIMVRAETAGRAHRAGLCDAAQDACRMGALFINGGTLLYGHDPVLSAAVIGATLVADYIGTVAGVRLGERLDRRSPQAPPAPMRVVFDGGNEQEFTAWLRKQIRIGGGRL